MWRHLTGWTATPLAPPDCGQRVTGHSWPLVAVILCSSPLTFPGRPTSRIRTPVEERGFFWGP